MDRNLNRSDRVAPGPSGSGPIVHFLTVLILTVIFVTVLFIIPSAGGGPPLASVEEPPFSDPGLPLTGGQQEVVPELVIPVIGGPQLSLSPESGPPGTTIHVTATGFPAAVPVWVGSGVQGFDPVASQTIMTDVGGSFLVQVLIPENSMPETSWFILASAQAGEGSSASAYFQVTGPGVVSQPEPHPQRTYVVQRGDTLSQIARQFNTTVRVLLRENPQIRNPSLIYPGQIIRIP